MCLKAGAPEKPKEGECHESHGMIAEMVIALTVMMTLSPLMRALNDRQA